MGPSYTGRAINLWWKIWILLAFLQNAFYSERRSYEHKIGQLIFFAAVTIVFSEEVIFFFVAVNL